METENPCPKPRVRNPRKIHQLPFMSRPYENMVLPSDMHSMGILQAPPPFLFHSCPSYSFQNSPQPPLLPLPSTHPRRSFSTGGLSCRPPVKKNSNRTRDQSLTPKNTKPPTKSPKQEEKKSPKKSSDTKELPKNVAKVSPPESTDNINGINIITDSFPSSAVFRISPPPSCLPLPSFSLRPKLRCNAEAAGVDDGATDNLRRLLRLQ